MIKVIVSTEKTQGQRYNDFCFVPEGELVMFGFVCDRDKNDPDSDCGCSRSLSGFNCRTATTTFKVAVKDLTKNQYTKMYVDAWRKTGFPVTSLTRLDADIMFYAAQGRQEGDVLEFRNNTFYVREPMPDESIFTQAERTK